MNAYHSSGSDDGDYLGEAAGIVLELENGTKLYFAGDTCVFGDMQLIARLYAPDVAILPIGGHFTMDPREAAVALELLGVKRCIPCHYGTFPLLKGTPDELRELAPGVEVIALEPGETIDGVRERWFGATGRRVPEIAVEGELELGDALVARRRLRRGRTEGGARSRAPGRRAGGLARGGQAGARAARGRLRARAGGEARAARARPDGADLWLTVVATYSIAACDLEAGQWGVATQSKFLAVGSVVPWAEPHVGAIATQAYANPRYGPDGLALLRDGLSADEVVERLTAADEGREHRQLGVVDAEGGSATLHGQRVHGLGGRPHRRRLRGPGQHPRLGRDRRRDRGDVRAHRGPPLAERLLDCLDAAQAAGGDRRGQQSAALLVVERDGGYAGLSDSVVDLRVDDHDRPLEELRRIYGHAPGDLRQDARRRTGSTSTTSSPRSCASGSGASATTASSAMRSSLGRQREPGGARRRGRARSIPSCSTS